MRQELVKQVVDKIGRGEVGAAGKSMTIGFDGFIDSIVRIVREHSESGAEHYRSKASFGQSLTQLATRNASFELTEVTTKIGGNMPIAAHALARLGVHVRCIGMLGCPVPDPHFASMDGNCELHSFANPSHSMALEFEDGKILLAKSDLLRTIGWQEIARTLGLSRLIDLYRDADAIGFANWGEIDRATEIWEGVERDILPHMAIGAPRIALFDLADSSRRTAQEFRRLAALVGRLTARCETVMCLNANEALALNAVLGGDEHESDVGTAGEALFAALDVHTLIVRHARAAKAWTRNGVVEEDTFYVERPRLSTGGGDNFNAGYCFARLAGLDVEQGLVIAAGVAGFYVTEGDSPTLEQLGGFLMERAPAADMPARQVGGMR
ncbi:hypothetical protein [Mesorhizobium sp. NPDC059025]|uniref:hypothetical protein n=1 Tax=unclassified Mesorhizobium TaxID=325217 RepID=UPI0036A4A71F